MSNPDGCQVHTRHADPHQRRLALREEGMARGRAHNRELHELGHIRRHGGFQRDLPF